MMKRTLDGFGLASELGAQPMMAVGAVSELRKQASNDHQPKCYARGAWWTGRPLGEQSLSDHPMLLVFGGGRHGIHGR